MGLFDKKYCSICGEKIGLLGNRKLTDGNLCKECARKLSPRFTERKQSTVEDIREQLKYREENKQKLGSFHVSETYGLDTEKLYLDAAAKAFVVSNVTPDKGNPDIVTLDMVTGCELDIDESKDEVKYRANDGRTCSYQPPQYERNYDFYLDISVNHPYFDSIRFQINRDSVTIEPQFTILSDSPLFKMFGGNNNSNNQSQLESPRVTSLPPIDPSTVPEYNRFVNMGNEIRARLLGRESASAPAAQPATAAASKVTCPYCGTETDAGSFCAYCGAPLK